MDWKSQWLSVFGREDWLGLNMGFWVALVVVVLLIVAMNLVCWCLPKRR